MRKFWNFFWKQGLFYLMGASIIGLSLLWFLPPRGLRASFYANRDWYGEPVFSERAPQITLKTVMQRQDSFPQRDFSAVWEGWIRIDRSGEYTFFIESDDGSSVFVNNNRIIDNGGSHPTRKRAGKVHLRQAIHHIRINYFQGAGAYHLKVSWVKPGGLETAIPADVLYAHPFPVRGIGFLTRYLRIVYPLSWLLFLGLLVGKNLWKSRGKLPDFKAFAQNLVLALVTILVFGVIAEGAIRLILYLRENRKDTQLLLKESQETDFSGGTRTYSLTGIVQPSMYEGIVYELKPNLRGNFRGAPLFTNSRGLRDIEYSYRKKEQTFRIVGLGDSSLFGWGVKLEDTSLKVLERALNQHASDLRYEVMNFAVPGYNTAIEAEVFVKKCLSYSPDLVIMHFNTNDYDVPGFMKPPERYSTLKKSYLLNFIYSRYQLLQGEEPQEVIPFVFDRTMSFEQSEYLDEDPNFPDEYRHLVGKKGFINAIDTLVEATKKHGIPLMVYVIKAYPGLDADYTPNEFKLSQLHSITELSKEKEFWLLNTYPWYVEYLNSHPDKRPRDFWVSHDDSHPSVLAHKIEAGAFYKFLREHNLVKLTD